MQGCVQFVNGKLRHIIGSAVGNQKLADDGYRQQLHGKADMVRGNAQQAIQHCLKRNGKSAAQ